MDEVMQNPAARIAEELLNPIFFPPELRTASVVSRWSIVWTLTRDNVANHSFYVALYAYQIARILSWTGPLDRLMFAALVDDLDETITGDIVSPVKEEIVDKSRSERFIRNQLRERMGLLMETYDHIRSCRQWSEIKAIIKVADRLDALLFLIVEHRLGNSVIEKRIPSALDRLTEAWFSLPWDRDHLGRMWNECIYPAIRDHQERGGEGI